MNLSYTPIGIFLTPFKDIERMPVQANGGSGVEGVIDVFPQYKAGLKNLQGFSHVFVLYHLHEIEGYELVVKPFLNTEKRGIFATRSPKRPNPIGLSLMRLKGILGSLVILEGIDVLDKTPVIDIKPYIADFDMCDADRFGWLEEKFCRQKQSDCHAESSSS